MLGSESASTENSGSGGEQAAPKTIAIDGPAASGKSDVGNLVARRLGYLFIDTGAMYRALTWLALQRRLDPDDEDAMDRLAAGTSMVVTPPRPGTTEQCRVRVDGEDATPHLRTPEVEASVSLVSRVPVVREALVRNQRELARGQPTVMAGRDIGTVVLPEADLKVYLEASRDERAHRRRKQLALKGEMPSFEGVLADLERRDAIDSTRPVSPMRPAADAIVISTDGLTLEEVVEKVLSLAERRS